MLTKNVFAVAVVLLCCVGAVHGATDPDGGFYPTLGQSAPAHGFPQSSSGGNVGAPPSDFGSIVFHMNQNGDTPVVTVFIGTEEESIVTSANLGVLSSVSWLSGGVHSATESSLTPATTHEVTFDSGELRLYDTDQVYCDVAFGDLSTARILADISYTPAPVTVLHDGYIAGGFMQSAIEYLAAGEFGHAFENQIGTWEEFGQSYDTYLIGQYGICDADPNARNLLVDNILPHNNDFVPDFFLYYGWVADPVNYPTAGRFGRVMGDYFYNDDYRMKSYTGTNVMVSWGPAIMNPLGFTVASGDTLWQHELYAQMVGEMISHSSNYVANMGVLFDYAEDMTLPWFQTTIDQKLWDLDGDGIAFGDTLETFFSPGDATQTYRPWGDVTEEEAYHISLRRCYTLLKTAYPNVRFSWNGQYGTDRSHTDAVNYKDFAMLERPRDVSSQTGSLEVFHAPTWTSFLDLCTTYGDELDPDNTFPWEQLHWDFRENLTAPRAGTDNLSPLMWNMGEGGGLMSNGITSFAYLDRGDGNGTPPSRRYATALDPVAASMDLGLPDGEVVVDGWGKAHRLWTDGRVDIQWAGDGASPVPYGWKVTDGEGAILRSVGWDSFPDVSDVDLMITYYNGAAENGPPSWINRNDFSELVAREHGHAYASLLSDQPDNNRSLDSVLSIRDSDIAYGAPIGDEITRRISMLYLGMENVLYGQNVHSASLTLPAGWMGIQHTSADTVIFAAITDPDMGRWLNDPAYSTWNEASPGEAWNPATWELGDFGPLAYHSVGGTLASGDPVVIDIGNIAEYAAANPDAYFGIAMFAHIYSGAGLAIDNFAFTSQGWANSKQEVYITATTGPAVVDPPTCTPPSLIAYDLTSDETEVTFYSEANDCSNALFRWNLNGGSWHTLAETDNGYFHTSSRNVAVDETVADGDIIYAAVQLDFCDYDACPSAWISLGSETLSIGEDTTPPAAPKNLVAVAGDGSVSLDWDDNGEADFAQYSVWIGGSSGGPYGQAATGLTVSEYTGSGYANGTTLYFVVVAHDNAGNNSADSNEVNATPAGAGSGNNRLIAVDHTLVDSDLTNYALLVSLDETWVADVNNGGSVARSDGNDILFSSDLAGTSLLDWEIEHYDNVNGVLVAWVGLPTMSATVDQAIYIHYGDSANVADQSNAGGVWADYTFVKHFNNVASYWTADGGDLTISENGSGPSVVENAAGIIGNCLEFVGTVDSGLSIAGVQTNQIFDASASSYTLQMMTNVTASDRADYIGMFSYTDLSRTGGLDIVMYGSGSYSDYSVRQAAFGSPQPMDVWTGVGSRPNNQWNLISLVYDNDNAGIYDPAAPAATGYVNGVASNSEPSTSADATGPPNDVSVDWAIIGGDGRYANGGTVYQWAGFIDEMRFRKSVLSADHIAAEHTNYSNPAGFYSVGVEK